MSTCLKLVSIFFVFASNVSTNLFSQTVAPPDSIKTVAFYSSKKSFFKDYPVDTLVSHLNSLNSNSKVVYYKSTEDQSRTGFYADYLIDLNVTLKMSTLEAPKWETIERTSPRSVRVARPDGTYEDRIQYITTRVEKYIEASISIPVSKIT